MAVAKKLLKIKCISQREGSAALSPAERLEDWKLQRHVTRAVQRQLQSGTPVARYDASKRRVYLEYADGRVEFQS